MGATGAQQRDDQRVEAWTTVSPQPDGTLRPPLTARYVRVTLTRAVRAGRTGIGELDAEAR